MKIMNKEDIETLKFLVSKELSASKRLFEEEKNKTIELANYIEYLKELYEKL